MSTYEDVRLRCVACHQDKLPEDFRPSDRRPILRKPRKCRDCRKVWETLYETGHLPLKREHSDRFVQEP